MLATESIFLEGFGKGRLEGIQEGIQKGIQKGIQIRDEQARNALIEQAVSSVRNGLIPLKIVRQVFTGLSDQDFEKVCLLLGVTKN